MEVKLDPQEIHSTVAQARTATARSSIISTPEAQPTTSGSHPPTLTTCMTIQYQVVTRTCRPYWLELVQSATPPRTPYLEVTCSGPLEPFSIFGGTSMIQALTSSTAT